jgi:hypothetical protein
MNFNLFSFPYFCALLFLLPPSTLPTLHNLRRYSFVFLLPFFFSFLFFSFLFSTFLFLSFLFSFLFFPFLSFSFLFFSFLSFSLLFFSFLSFPVLSSPLLSSLLLFCVQLLTSTCPSHGAFRFFPPAFLLLFCALLVLQHVLGLSHPTALPVL